MSDKGFFIHVGLPRTATTILQREVFPNLPDMIYLGKNWNNTLPIEKFQPLKLISNLVDDFHKTGHLSDNLRAVLPGILGRLKAENQFNHRQGSQMLVELMHQCMNLLQDAFSGNALLYSDESLIESVAGLSSNLMHGARVPLEQLAAVGVLEKVTVLLVLRDPLDFLRASWYKNNEFQYRYKLQPICFDEWIRKQMALYIRKPTASRIFLAMHKSFSKQVASYCPNIVVSQYEELLIADDLMLKLTNGVISSPEVNLKSFPKENQSFRDKGVVDFILSAPGVPAGISMKEYISTFEKTYQHYELLDLLNSERLEQKIQNQ